MAKIKKSVMRAKKQPVTDRLPAHALNKTAGRRGGRRTRNLFVNLSAAHRYQISLRRFRTNKDKRSKRKPQIVIAIPYLAIREIAITRQSQKRRILGKQRPLNPFLRRLKLAATLPLLAGILGMAFFGPQIKQPVNIQVTPAGRVLAATTTASPKTMPASTPTTLRIDKINVNSPMVGVDLAADGSLGVPPQADQAGWYSKSSTPGQLGPAVIDGHVDQVGGIGIFWRLRELTPGDIIEVDRTDGTTAKFKVDAIKQYPQENFNTAEVYGKINYAGIRLITCSGIFNPVTHRYSHNLVVFGSLI